MMDANDTTPDAPHPVSALPKRSCQYAWHTPLRINLSVNHLTSHRKNPSWESRGLWWLPPTKSYSQYKIQNTRREVEVSAHGYRSVLHTVSGKSTSTCKPKHSQKNYASGERPNHVLAVESHNIRSRMLLWSMTSFLGYWSVKRLSRV